jgi:signal transduction histidine kinase
MQVTSPAAAVPGSSFVTRNTRPRLLDAMLAWAAFALQLLLLSHGGMHGVSGSYKSLDATAVVLAGASTLPLHLWRRSPLGVFAVTTLASSVLNLLHYPPGPPLGPTIALFLVALSGGERGRWRRPAIVVVSLLLLVHVASAGIGERALPFVPLVFGILVWAVAWFAGERVRLRRERLAALAERADRAARDAERERRLATAEERMRIARDLHDSAGHAINVILVQAGAARLLQDRDPARSRAAIETIEEVARHTVDEIDHLVRTLRDGSVVLDDVDAHPGLAALDTLVDRHRQAGLDITVDRSGDVRPLPAPVDQTAYRIMQEALTNAARHGSGGANVRLEYALDELELTVSNPVPAVAAEVSGGHGLIGMRERTALLGGSLSARLSDGAFTVHAVLPYVRSAA